MFNGFPRPVKDSSGGIVLNKDDKALKTFPATVDQYNPKLVTSGSTVTFEDSLQPTISDYMRADGMGGVFFLMDTVNREGYFMGFGGSGAGRFYKYSFATRNVSFIGTISPTPTSDYTFMRIIGGELFYAIPSSGTFRIRKYSLPSLSFIYEYAFTAYEDGGGQQPCLITPNHTDLYCAFSNNAGQQGTFKMTSNTFGGAFSFTRVTLFSNGNSLHSGTDYNSSINKYPQSRGDGSLLMGDLAGFWGAWNSSLPGAYAARYHAASNKNLFLGSGTVKMRSYDNAGNVINNYDKNLLYDDSNNYGAQNLQIDSAGNLYAVQGNVITKLDSNYNRTWQFTSNLFVNGSGFCHLDETQANIVIATNYLWFATYGSSPVIAVRGLFATLVGYNPKSNTGKVMMLNTSGAKKIRVSEANDENDFKDKVSGDLAKWNTTTLIHKDDVPLLEKYILVK